jgi:hypothetical protein
MQTQNFNRKHRQMRRSRKYAMVLVLKITQGAPVYGHRATGLRTLRNVLGSLCPGTPASQQKSCAKEKRNIYNRSHWFFALVFPRETKSMRAAFLFAR